MQDLRLRTAVSIERLLDQLDDSKPGSEESQRIAESITKLYKVCIEDIKAEEEIFNNDTERQEIQAKTKEIKARLEKQDKWYELIKPDTIATCGTMTILTLLAFRLEKAGYVLPRTLKFVDKLKI